MNFVDRHSQLLEIGNRAGGVIVENLRLDQWVVTGNRGAGSQGAGDDAGSSGARATRARAGPAGARAGCTPSCLSTGSSGNHAGVDAAENATCRGAQNVSLGDGNVVTRDHDIEIIFEREVDRVAQGQVE